MADIDARRMNRMDAQTKIVHARLERWGKWARDTGLRAWPEVTLLGRIIEEGAHGAQSTGRAPISMPDDIAIVDAAVCNLVDLDRRVVRKYYLEWAPPECMARQLRISVDVFQHTLKRGRWRVASFIDGAEFVCANKAA